MATKYPISQSKEVEQLLEKEAAALDPGGLATYVARVIPGTEGLYTVYAYLYDGDECIDRRVERSHVQPASH